MIPAIHALAPLSTRARARASEREHEEFVTPISRSNSLREHTDSRQQQDIHASSAGTTGASGARRGHHRADAPTVIATVGHSLPTAAAPRRAPGQRKSSRAGPPLDRASRARGVRCTAAHYTALAPLDARQRRATTFVMPPVRKHGRGEPGDECNAIMRPRERWLAAHLRQVKHLVTCRVRCGSWRMGE